jgi:hypothetical protein
MTAVVPRPAPSAPVDVERPAARPAATGTARGWVWPAAATVLGAAGALYPVPTLALLIGVTVVALAVAAPRPIAGLTALAVLFVRPIEHVVPIPQVGYIDEALILLCVVAFPLRRVVLRQPLRTFPGQWWFAAFLVCGILSALVLHVPFSIFLLAAFIISKGLLFGWAVAQVDWTERHVATMARVGAAVIIFCLAATLVNLAIPGAWEAVLSSDPNASEARSFLPSVIGPFSHPIDLGQFMALSFIALAAWRATVGRSALTLVLLVSTGLVALATARRTAIGSIVAAWLWLQAKVRSTRVVIALLACLPVAVVVLATPVASVVTTTYQDYLGNGNPEARTVLTVDSFKVAADHFPGGAGFGRFASAVAATNYSPEYVARGYPTIWGLGQTRENGRFLTDTEWPAIIGESGFLGALGFALGLIAAYRAGLRLWSSGRAPLVRWVGLASAGWLVTCTVQSVATVTFTGPPVFGLLFGLVGIVCALSDRSSTAAEGPDPAIAPDATAPDATRAR